MKIKTYLKENKENGTWEIEVYQTKVHTLLETIEVKDQEHYFEILDKHQVTPNNTSLGDFLENGYYKRILTVVGIGYTGVKSHIASAIYRESNGTKHLAYLTTECGSDRWGSGIRWGEDFDVRIPTEENITCKKCQKAFAKMNK